MMLERLDNLQPFQHPENGRRYRHMRPAEVEELVEELRAAVERHLSRSPQPEDVSPADPPLLWVESGSQPLARLLSERLGIEARGIKVPREVTPALSKYLLFMLRYEEREEALSAETCSALNALARQQGHPAFPPGTREQAVRYFSSLLREEPPTSLQQALASYLTVRSGPAVQLYNLILRDTEWAQRLAQPLLLLDEYVTSGTVLSVVNQTLALFNPAFTYWLLTYSFNTRRQDAPPYLLHSVLYGPPAQQAHAYPFENRLDLLGFFYTETERELVRTELRGRARPEGDGGLSFLRELQSLLTHSDASERINNALPMEQLREYNQLSHLTRFSLYLLEERELLRDFWLQLFEMYAPSWSPLPVDFHLGFTGAYHAQEDWLRARLQPLRAAYGEAADRLLEETAFQLSERHNQYWQAYSKHEPD